MMKPHLLNLVCPLLLLPAVAGAQVPSKPFGQADLQRIVAELDPAIPHNARYAYPVHCSIVESDKVNAYATAETAGSGLQAKMVVYTGFVKAVGGDERLVRACVAHELSHLSRGHVRAAAPSADDLRNLWVRQEEYEADAYGAAALVKTGHAKKDMVDLLLFLDRDQGRGGDWLDRLTADHADPKARAAQVADDPKALDALVLFDTGLAYEDSREHLYAEKLFDAAAGEWPALTEANINAAKCALMFYYDNLPGAVRQKWWRPDFGPLILEPHVTPQAVEVTDQDREAWRDAYAEAEKAVKTNPSSDGAQEIRALAQVLEPDAKKEVVQSGIDWFKAHQSIATDPATRLRYANNQGVGYQRTGSLDIAYATIFDALKGARAYSPALGENLGRVTVKGRRKDDDVFAANVLYGWLGDTPETNPNWATVKTTFDSIVTAQNLAAKPIEHKPVYLCKVTTLVTSDKRLGILLPVANLKRLLGEPSSSGFYDKRWPDLTEAQWHNGALRVLTERGQIMRLTSSEPGAYLVLKPTDPTSQLSIQIKVGMTKAELFGILNEKSSIAKELVEGGEVRSWTYFPGFGMGVLVDGGVVKAITVSPVKVD